MNRNLANTLILTPLVMLALLSCSSKKIQSWILIEDDNGKYGYVNDEGDTVINPGKYSFCFSDTFLLMGIVYHDDKGMVAINREEEILFKVFPYDNGPDYPSEGLFRILEGKKIGYANLDGEIIIKPQFICAFPFENGKAKVSLDCVINQSGEHSNWSGGTWFYIDKEGNIIN